MYNTVKAFFANSGKEDFTFLLKKSSLALIFRFGTFISTYIFVFAVARNFGASVWGSYALCFTVLQIFSIFSLWGLDSLIVRTLARKPEENPQPYIKTNYLQSLMVILCFSVLLSALLYAIAPFLSNSVFKKPALQSWLQLMAFGLVPFALMNYHAACFRGMKHMTGLMIFRMLLSLFAAIIVTMFNFSNITQNPVYAFLSSIFIVVLISAVSWIKFSGISGISSFKQEKFSSVLSQSTPLLLTGSVFFILGWADTFLLGVFRSEKEVGIYDAAFKIAAAPAIVLVAINAIQAPVFASLFSGGKMNELKQNIKSGSKILFYAAAPVSALILLFPDLLLGIFGSEFREARVALIVLTIGSFMNAWTGSVGILLQMTGRQSQYNRIVLVAAAINISLNIYLIPELGITGAAIASATAKIFQNFVAAAYVKKVYGVMSVHVPSKSDF